MDKKVTSIVAYAGILAGAAGLFPALKLGMFLPIVVWLVAYFAGDKNGAKVHLNQSLVVIIAGLAVGIVCWILGLIPIIRIIGAIINIIVTVLTIVIAVLGIMAAVKGEDKKFPFVGDIAILK